MLGRQLIFWLDSKGPVRSFPWSTDLLRIIPNWYTSRIAISMLGSIHFDLVKPPMIIFACKHVYV